MWSQPRQQRAVVSAGVDAARRRHPRPRASAAHLLAVLLAAAAAAAASRAGAFCGGLQSGRAPSAAMRQAPENKEPPQQKSLLWARDLANKFNIDLPLECEVDKVACANFIKQHRKKTVAEPAASSAAAKPAAKEAQAKASAPKKAATAPAEPEPVGKSAAKPAARKVAKALSPSDIKGAVAPLQKGLYADLFKVPIDCFPPNVYHCQSLHQMVGNPREPRGYKTKDFTYVQNLWPGKGDSIVVSREGPAPENRECQEISAEDLQPLQRANLVAVLMQVDFDSSQSERWAADPTMSVTQTVRGKRMTVDMRPTFNFRGSTAEGEAFFSATLTHSSVPPSDLNLGLVNVEGKTDKAVRDIVKKLEGMKVLPFATENGEPDKSYEVCAPTPGKKLLLDEEERERLLGLTKLESTRKSLQDAPVGSLLLDVAENCRREDAFLLTYLASRLRPTLGPRNQEKVRRVIEGFQPFPPKSSSKTSSPQTRNELLKQELARQRSRQAWLTKVEHLQEHNTGASVQFGKLPTTKLILDKGKSITGLKGIYSALKSGGPVLVDGQAKKAKGKLHGIVFGPKPSPEETKAAREICNEILLDMQKMNVGLAKKCEVLEWKDLKSPETALDEAGLGPHDMALLFGSKSLVGRQADDVHKKVKTASLKFGAKNQPRHLASQWIDLSSRVWLEKKKRGFHNQNVVEAAVAKLGHVPFGVDISSWGRKTGKEGTLVAGYDVCHIGRVGIHVAAGVRVTGEESRPMVLTGINSEVRRIEGELVPDDFLRQLVPADAAANKLVIVHRDGRFRSESAMWKEYYEEELKPRGASLQLVEVVKTATGVPRLYRMGVKPDNVGEGTYLRINENEYILASTEKAIPGTTIHPVKVTLIDTFGDVAKSSGDPAWVKSVFDLSYMHHGSVFKKPKLPVTTLISDRFAGMVADWNIDLDDTVLLKMSGSQQPWL